MYDLAMALSKLGTYDAKLGCDNCGLAAFYKIQRGYEVMPHECAEDARDGIVVLSHIRKGADNKDGDSKPLECHNCHLPFLMIVGWEKSELDKATIANDTKR